MHLQHLQKRTASCAADARQMRLWFRGARGLVVLTAICCCGSEALAFRVVDATDFGLGIGRWDAAPHFVDGVERSLHGGLRYSVEGGSYEAFRDQFQWQDSVPSVAEFQALIEQAFADWEAVDPASRLGTDLYFVPDFDTPVFLEPFTNGGFVLNRGAEIDLFAEPLTGLLGQANGFGDPNANSVTLTSGVENYPAAVASGGDVLMDSSDRVWPRRLFKDVLSHEIGHALGLADVDIDLDFTDQLESGFYDDNYDDTSSATALATLTNSFAHLIDPLDPDNSPALMLYDVCDGDGPGRYDCYSDPGIDSPGVSIHMESSDVGGVGVDSPQNDDFAGRQFLYPYVQPCDFDADGQCDVTDIDRMQALGPIASGLPATGNEDFDLNGDGVIDLTDRDEWLAMAATENGLGSPYKLGDANIDGVVDGQDFIAWNGSKFTSDLLWSHGDFNADGVVDGQDFILWNANKFMSSDNGSAVPEPSVGILWMAALIGLAVLRPR